MKTKTKTHVRMFQPQFHDMVADGIKRQTIRKRPKREINIGDHLSLRGWLGLPYRSKQFLIADAVVKDVQEVNIFGDSIQIDGIRLTKPQREQLAKDDGFKDFDAMVQWFRDTHGLPFEEGILIKW